MSTSQCSQWLLDQHIKVPTDWLEACLEWLRNENDGQNMTITQIQQQVLQQWLVTDLSELSHRVLPKEVKDDKYTLNGIYSVQVNSVTDISQPLYGQLLKTQNLENPNSHVSAETQATQKPWETKPTRMLMIKLTDGLTEVSGMEYRRISCISENMIPGCKIRIKGPILCKRGILMLAGSNVQVLGGEVEDLLETNSKEALLCQRLNRPPPTRPMHQASEQQNNTIDIDLPQDLITQLTNDEFETDFDSGYLTLASNPPPSNINNAASTAHVDAMGDLSDSDLLQEMARIETQQTPQNISNCDRVPEDRSRSSVEENVWLDDDDDDVIFIQAVTSGVFEQEKSVSTKYPGESSSGMKQISLKDSLKREWNNTHEKFQTTLTETISNPARREYVAPPHLKRSASNDRECRLAKKPAISLFQSSSSTTHSTLLSTLQTDTKTYNIKLNNSEILTNVKKEQRTRSENLLQTEKCPSLLSRLQKQTKSVSSLSNSAHRKGLKSSQSCAISSGQTISYLCQIKHELRNKVPVVSFTVKAFIVTLLSKLQSSPENGWSLRARICDGTDVLDAEFSNQVLKDLIGFTSDQAEKIKRSCDTSLIENLRHGMAKCRSLIIGMCKLMKIEYQPSTDIGPFVNQLLDMDEACWADLRSRQTR